MQDAWNQLNKTRLAENDESDAQRKNSEEADMVIDMTAEHRNEVMQRQVLAIQRVQGAQGMVEVLKVRSSNDVMDVSEVKQRQVLTSIQTDQTIEVPRKLKPAGERTSVQERVRQLKRNGSALNTLEVPRASPSDGQSEDPEDEAPHKKRKQESDPDQQAPVHFSLCDGSSDQGTESVDDFAELGIRSRGVPVEQLDDVLLEVRDMKSELLRLRELVGVLVRRERCAEVKMEVAARRLDWMEHEKTKSTLPSMKPFLRKISRTSPKS